MVSYSIGRLTSLRQLLPTLNETEVRRRQAEAKAKEHRMGLADAEHELAVIEAEQLEIFKHARLLGDE